MSVYLIDHPPASRQYRSPRRETPSGLIVVHTAENTPDTIPEDRGAEAVAAFIANRSDPGSYHVLCDADSIVNLVRYTDEAFHDATGSNPHSFGLSAATQAHRWADMPGWWVDGCIENMAAAAAKYARWIAAEHGVIIPPVRVTRDESEARVPGFISHAERDPARRTDPGEGFPWTRFLREFEDQMNPTLRGEKVDQALALTRQATAVALDIHRPKHQATVDEAVKHLRAARRALRSIPRLDED